MCVADTWAKWGIDYLKEDSALPRCQANGARVPSAEYLEHEMYVSPPLPNEVACVRLCFANPGCGGTTHGTVWEQYAKMRDALNKTGRPIYYRWARY